MRCSDKWRAKYDRVKRGTQKRNKIAIVTVMRQLGTAETSSQTLLVSPSVKVPLSVRQEQKMNG